MAVIVPVFFLVYAGMMLGRLPGLKVDRAAIALLGVIALVASEEITEEQAVGFVSPDTMSLLFGLMIVSAQFTMSGLYGEVTRRVVLLKVGPRILLAVLIAVTGIMAALLTNDVVALAMAPILLQLCLQRNLNPIPYLLAMACSANTGSTATIIGSPQNMLIGQHMSLSFTEFLIYAAAPSALSLAVIWVVISLLYRGKWELSADNKAAKTAAFQFDRLESFKGLAITAAIIGIFVFTDWPRELVALAAGGILLLNARFQSREMLGLVDWQLLILFIGLFVVNGAFQQTELPQHWVDSLRAHGVDFQHPASIFLTTAILSDLVSNVPAIMLLIPFAQDPIAGPAMALAAGMASNLIIIGSIANIIVVDTAARSGLKITFREHARTGIPVTILSLLIAGAWLWLIASGKAPLV
ncbi:MAG: SLC13 family permease [Pseudomonadota bacterium]|nr:SLC13 family permease [Pseudomonadota bacterium]